MHEWMCGLGFFKIMISAVSELRSVSVEKSCIYRASKNGNTRNKN
jgi:hypothetical protein